MGRQRRRTPPARLERRRDWKVRRLKREPRVLIAAASFKGVERGERLLGRARLVADPGINELLRRKYGWQKRALDLLNRRTPTDSWATIEIVDAASD